MNLYPNIRAGRLRFPITIMAPSKVQDAVGGMVAADDQVFASVWADIEAVTQQEVYSALQITAEANYKITMRWIPGIKANMQVVYPMGSPPLNRVFQIIVPVDPDGRQHVLYLICLERADSAYAQA